MIIEGRVLWVAGGRDYDEYTIIDQVLASYMNDDWTLITGAARGADLTAEEVYRDNQRPYIGIPAHWAKHGKRAGYMRNNQIARMHPDALVAFPGGRGTQHSVALARDFGIEVERVS